MSAQRQNFIDWEIPESQGRTQIVFHFRVANVLTDFRLSGSEGQVPTCLHANPE